MDSDWESSDEQEEKKPSSAPLSAQLVGRSTDMAPFGNSSTPFAEPSWYARRCTHSSRLLAAHQRPSTRRYSNTLTSPYYTDKHRRVRAAARAYHDELAATVEDWEAGGEVPQQAIHAHAEAGFVHSGLLGVIMSSPVAVQVDDS